MKKRKNILRLKGIKQNGLGAASTSTLPAQFPFFKKYIPNIDNYHKGTINLLLDYPLIINTFDIKTAPIEWISGFFEEFGFLKIKLELIKNGSTETVDNAFIYIPHKSPHYTNWFYKEILTHKLDLSEVLHFHIIIEKEYRKLETIIV